METLIAAESKPAYKKKIITQITKPTCKFCDKVVDVKNRIKIGNKELLKLSCNHTLYNVQLKEVELDFFDTFESHRGDRLLPFQKVGAKFVVDANGRALIADEMGLGKTVQALAVLKCMEEANPGTVLPAVIVSKASLTTQWTHQDYSWCGEDFALVRRIKDARYDKPQLGVCPITVVSYDSLIRMDWFGEFEVHGHGKNKVELYKRNEKNCGRIKTVILDETQQIKNRNSKRAKAIREICRDVPFVIGLSGTPIKNNAAEYFSILNILKPDRFNNFNHFTFKYVDTISNGRYGPKFGGITSYSLDRFHEDTKDFIIRRTQEEVMPELPKVWRDHKFYELGPEVEESYIKLVEEFQKEGKITGMNIISYLNRMRYLTGIAKVGPTVELAEEFLLSFPGKKLAIFSHHHDVAKLIAMRLRETCKDAGYDEPIVTVDENGSDKFECVERWKNNTNCPIFIGTILACGEGLNMQFCDTAIMVEREWNPANEEQTEKRFPRIGIDKSISKIKVIYPTALGTIDEFFAEMVEKKRGYMKGALDNEVVDWNEASLIKDLGEMLMTKGLSRWRIVSE